MDVGVVVELRIDPELGRVRADPRQRGDRGLLHHVAELPGQRQSLATRHRRGLDRQHLAADRRPRQPDRRPRRVERRGGLVLVALRPEQLAHPLRTDGARRVLLLGERLGGTPHHVRDLALEIAQPGLAGVLAGDLEDPRVGDLELQLLEPVLAQHLRDQVALGDLELLEIGVAREPDHLHAVAQRRRHRVEVVGGGDEQHLRQIERHVEVVVHERVVLRRIEHLEQRRRRIAVEIHGQLVDLVQHEHRVPGAGAADPADDVPGQRPDVGAPVPADLRLVPHAAQRLVHELASQRARDRLPERGLAGARRPDEAQDRRARVRLEAPHHQVLEDALLDLVEPVVILVQDLAGVDQVEVVLGPHRPRHVHQPLKVAPRDRVLRGLRRHARQPVQLAVRLLLHLRRHPRLLHPLAQLGDLLLAVLALAQLLADRLHLLAEEELLLVLVDVLAHRVADLRADLEHLQLAVEDLRELAQALLHVGRLEQFLLVGDLEVEQRGDEVRDPPLARLGARRAHRLVRDRRDQAHHALELLEHLLGQRLGLDVGALGLGQRLDPCLEVGRGGLDVRDAHAGDALEQHRITVVLRLHHPQHRADGADLVELGRRRVVERGITLRHHRQRAIARHHVVQQLDALLAPDVERQDPEREQHRVPDRQHRQLAGLERRALRALGLGLGGDRDLLGAGHQWDSRGSLRAAVASPSIEISVRWGAGTRFRRTSSMPSL